MSLCIEWVPRRHVASPPSPFFDSPASTDVQLGISKEGVPDFTYDSRDLAHTACAAHTSLQVGNRIHPL